MAVKRATFMPTLMPEEVIAPQRQRKLNMLQPGFYQQSLQQPETVRPEIQTLEPAAEQASPGPPVGKKEETPEDRVKEQIERIRAQGPAPSLQPGQRVKSPDTSLVQPDQFRTFYEQLNTIGQIGQRQLGAERMRQQFRQMESLQNIMAQGPPGFGGVNLKYDKNARSKSAPLNMLGDVLPYVRRAAQEISGKFGIGNIGGHATSGHIPGSDHYTGKALDVMLGGRSGGGIANYAIKHAGRLGVKYIIYNRRYWEPGSGWTRYTGSNPHTGHVHLSFR